MLQITAPHDEFYFMRERVVDVDAAVVGISKNRWTSIAECELTGVSKAAAIMEANRFDVLPILSSNGTATDFFRTSSWGDYSSIVRTRISHLDVIPVHTHIRDVLKSFVLENRYFYFLTNEERIAGLISIVNFNCRQVKIYLFSLVSELEIRLGELLRQFLSEDQIFSIITRNPGKQWGQAKTRIRKDKEAGVEVPAVEYLYLAQLFEIAAREKLSPKFSGDSQDEFKAKSLRVNELRNQIAHPTKSLINHPDSCSNLWQTVDWIEGILFALRQLV